MRHASVQQLSAFVDGALVGVSRELVTRHLAACESCRERYASWMANDDALRRVLAWEPDERTLEEWSSRIEMTITAERKGLPRPEFTEQLHPVIAPAPEVDGERLNSAVESARAARRGEPAPEAESKPAPPPPAPAKPAPPVAKPQPAAKPQLSAKQKRNANPPPPKKPQAVAKPQPVVQPAPAQAPAPPPVVAAAPTPEPVAAPAPATAPPVMKIEEPPPPVRAPAPELVAPAMPSTGVVPPWSEIALPAAETWIEPPQASPEMAAHVRVADAIEHAESRERTRAARRWRVRRRAAGRPVLLAAIAILLIVLAGSPLVPEVIRIPLPDRWGWRLPRVEFVRHGHEAEPDPVPSDAGTRLATRVTAEPEIVPPAPIPAPVETTATRAPAAPDTIAATDDVWAQSTQSITEPRPSPPRRAKPKKRTTPPPEPEPEPEPLTWPESPGTIVPTRVTTSVVTPVAPAKPAPRPAPPPAPPPSVESEADWPLLCGTVVDGAGEPFEGALVVLPVNALSVRTDRRGRFCVACPPGSQPIRVEAQGQETVMRTVELTSGMVEIRISLTPQ